MWIDVYTITDVGRELCHDLLADQPEELARNKSELLARVANFAWLRPEERLRVLDVRDRAVSRSLERLRVIAATQADPWHRRVSEEICRRHDSERAWLADLRGEIQASIRAAAG